MAEIYYAEDEQELREIVAAFLQNDGHTVTTFATGDLLLAAFRQKPCDLVILDIMMPGTDGIGILTALRTISTVPVILLTAKDSDSDYYSGLALGSDDYITKPFKPMLLAAKVQALLRRVQFEKQPLPTDGGDLICGNLRYDSKHHACTVNGRTLALTPTELRFLRYMMAHFDEAISKNTLLDAVWNISSELESRVADETNRRLRKKLNDAGSDVYVQTIWGYGLKLTRKDGSA